MVSVTGGGLLELWGGMAGIKGGSTALEPICSRGNCGGQTVVMQAVGGRWRSSADGMVFFFCGWFFRQGAAGTLRRLDRDRGSSGCLMLAFRWYLAAGGRGASRGELCRRNTALWGGCPHSGSACSEGWSSSSRRSGRGGLHVCAEGQTASKQSNYCTARGEQAGRCGGGVLCSKKAVRSG